MKQNWAKTAIHVTRELDLVTFHMKDDLMSDEASKIDVRTLSIRCKNSKTTGSTVPVRGTPCKCWGRSQQMSSPGLRLRLTPLLVLMKRVCMYGEYHILWSLFLLLIFLTKHTSHTCGRSCRPARYLSSNTHSLYFQAQAGTRINTA